MAEGHCPTLGLRGSIPMNRSAFVYCVVAVMGLLATGCTTTGDPAGADRAEVASSLADMGAAANAHDVDRHVSFYANDPSTILIFDGEAILGWDAIREKQREPEASR